MTQLQSFLQRYKEIVEAEELTRFSNFSSQYFTSRISRGKEITSDKITQAMILKDAFHGKTNHFFFVTCIDGRNIPTIMFSYVPRLGGFLRTRAGDIFEFQEMLNTDDLKINSVTEIYKKICALLLARPNETVYYGLDSHLGCAARKEISQQEGSQRLDDGLLDDIKRKLKITRAITQIREKLAKKGKQVAYVVPDLFSYDPHKGTIIYGLETIIDDPEFASDDFNLHFGIDKLVSEGKIIDTWALLQEAEIVDALRKSVKPVDFRTDYADGLLSNWKAITDLYQGGNGSIFLKIKRALQSLYDNKLTDDHIDHKAKIILKNLVTRWAQAENKATITDSDGKETNAWPFGEHEERTIVISERVFGPFESIEKFVVTPATIAGDQEMLDNATTGLNLVRKFRPKDEAKMPVLVDSQVIVRAFNKYQPTEREAAWELIRMIDFSFLTAIDWDDPETWRWGIQDVSDLWRKQLEKTDVSSGRVTLEVKYFIWESFARMRAFLGNNHFRTQLKNGNVIILHTIVNRDGKPELILPIAPRL